MRTRRWTWTLNNPTLEERKHITEVMESYLKREITYMLYGIEEAPTTGTIHYQGYLEMKNVKSAAQIKALLSSRIHLEASKGSSLQNQEYCKKDGKYVLVGTPMKQGKRTDLDRIQTDIEAGLTEKEIAAKYFSQWCRMRGAFKAYAALIAPVDIGNKYKVEEFLPEWASREFGMTTILWGASGIGKTSFLKARYPSSLFVSHVDDLLSFDKEKHEAIIFDDMDFKHIPGSAQIHLVDFDDDRSIHCRYSCAFIPRGTRKFFTTNVQGGEIFDMSNPAILRRVEVVWAEKLYERK